MKNLKIGAKLGLAFALIAMLAVVLGSFAINSIKRIQVSVSELPDNVVPSLVNINAVNSKLSDIRRLETLVLLTTDAAEQASLKTRASPPLTTTCS